MSYDFSDLSKELTKNLTENEKKTGGIYFTPPLIIIDILNIVKKHHLNLKSILEPSCGSGEFLTYLLKEYDKSAVTGIEYNKTIFDKITDIFDCQILNMDFLKYTLDKKYDLIIGNPPYFVLPKKQVDKSFLKYFDGRPNIYILFIIKSFELLSLNGIIAFVLPNNFMNCMYYNKLRLYINDNFQIIDIKDHSDKKFINTSQNTIALIIKKTHKNTIFNKDYTFQIGNNIVFNEKIKINKIKHLFYNATTLKQLGFKVTVGTIIWNQCKNLLTNDSTKTRLIYSGDLKDNQLVLTNYQNTHKKNYIDKPGLTDKILVVNRGYGVGNYTFNYCLIDMDKPFLIENHLICILSNKKDNSLVLKDKFQKIIKSFENPKTNEFIKLYFSNNAINTKELEELFPIFV